MKLGKQLRLYVVDARCECLFQTSVGLVTLIPDVQSPKPTKRIAVKFRT